MTAKKITLAGLACVLFIAAIAVSQSSTNEKPIFRLYGNDISKAAPTNPAFNQAVDNTDMACLTAIEVSIQLIEQKLISDNAIKADPDALNEKRLKYAGAVTTETVSNLNSELTAAVTIAEAFIEKYGENSVTPSNIDEFYNDNSTSPAVKLLSRNEFSSALNAYGKSQRVVEEVRNSLPNSLEPMQQQLDQNLQGSLQKVELRKKVAANQELNEAEFEAVKATLGTMPNLIEFTVSDDIARAKAVELKRDYIYNLFIARKLREDATPIDAAEFEKCLNIWENQVIDPWKSVFTNVTVPSESEL